MTEEALRWVEPDWPAPARVRALTTERSAVDPVQPYAGFNLARHVDDDAARVAANRRTLRSVLQLPREPSWLDQRHGIRVIDLDREPEVFHGDGSFTQRTDKVSAVLTADCAPIFLTDREGNFVGLVHGGWRGIACGIVEQAVNLLPAHPEEMLAWVGPAIGPCHFEIGPEVRAQLIAHPEDEQYFRSAGDRYLADLPGLIVARLQRAKLGYVVASRLCTVDDPARWYSYRRQGACGRMASLIWLVD